MTELLVKAYIEDRQREIDHFLRGVEALRYARLSADPRNSWLNRLLRPGQRASRASSARLAAGHSPSTIE